MQHMNEDLRKWFGTGKTGGVGGGGWDRYNTKGERIGKCGDAKDRGGKGEGKPKCLSREKAAQLNAKLGKGPEVGERQMDAAERRAAEKRLDKVREEYADMLKKIEPVKNLFERRI